MYASKRGQQHLRENKKQKTSKLLGSRGTGVTFDYIHILNTSFIYNILTYICTCMCVIFVFLYLLICTAMKIVQQLAKCKRNQTRSPGRTQPQAQKHGHAIERMGAFGWRP